MKKSDFTHIPEQIKHSMLRFPVAVLFCVALFVLDCLGIGDRAFSPDEGVLIKLNMLLPLGFVAAVGLRIFAQDINLRGWRGYPDVLLIPLLTLYFFLLPDPKDYGAVVITCFAVFCLTALVLLCVAPWQGGKQPLRLWQYNVDIWCRVLFAFIGASVFFGGFSLALFALETLFGVHVTEKGFLYVAVSFYILFTPLFFIAGIPDKSQIAEATAGNYPVLRVLGQYILLPVLATYLVILYTYGLKILFTWHLPNGWVSWLILIYSGVGLFIYCLLHNLYVTRESKMAVFFSRSFFYSLLPLIVLLFVAISRRISDYGFTEKRYYLLLVACWLAGVSLYMVLSREKSIRLLLISLATIALVSLVGPWSAFNVSEASQRHRLENAQNTVLLPEEKELQSIDLRITDEHNIHIAGYDYLLKGRYEPWRTDERVDAKDSLMIYTVKSRPEGHIEVYNYGRSCQTINLQALCDSILATVDSATASSYPLPESQLSIVIDEHSKIIFSHIRGESSPGRKTFKLQDADFDILRK
jgi:hypothetical protein